MEDKLTYLRNCKHRQTYNHHPSRKREYSVFTPRPPTLEPSTEYDHSLLAYERNLRILQQQVEVSNPDKEVVMDLMEKTFYMRRQNILKASTSVAGLLKTFPCLRSHVQVSKHAQVLGLKQIV